MNYLVNNQGQMSLYSGNALPKIHCRGLVEHKNRPMCGKKLPKEFCVSRKEFMQVPWSSKCQACANTKYARSL